MNSEKYKGGTVQINGEAFTDIRVRTEVDYTTSGGGARITFIEERDGRATYRVLFRLEVAAEFADQMIEALAPIVASRSAGWPHVWVKAPGPHYREEGAGR